MSHSFSFTVRTFNPSEPFVFSVEDGEVALVVGPNGSGKSALLYELYRGTSAEISSYIPGHRNITFSQNYDNLQIALTDIDNQFFSNPQIFNRYRNQWSEEQFKSILRRLLNSQTAHTQRILDQIRADKSKASLVDIQNSPLDVVNRAFVVANIPISITLTPAGITASREGYAYGVERLSDGERAALYIVSAIATSRPHTVLLVDEPERHLHPSISAALISTAIRSRPDVAFILASHDLHLIETLSADRIIYVQKSHIVSADPEQRQFQLVSISDLHEVSNDLKRDILGARDKVLFVEGESTSLDRALYSAAFPSWKVSPRGGADKVMEATNALRDNQSLHWIDVRGIVDGDGRGTEERATLAQKQVDVLSVPSIENLFFIQGVIKEAVKLTSSVDLSDPQAKIAALAAAVPTMLTHARDEIVARKATWIAARTLSSMKPSVEDFRNGDPQDLTFKPSVLRARCAAEIDRLIAKSPSIRTLEQVPIKNTGLPASIAKMLGFKGDKEYKQSILRHIEESTPAGKRMLKHVRARLPQI